MGYMRHHTIVVTSWDDNLIEAAHQAAHDIFSAATTPGGGTLDELITPILGPTTNGYRTFVVVPDGSKEWWDTSDAGDEARSRFIEWLRANYCDWVEVQFGDDEHQTFITSHSDEERTGEGYD